MSTIKPNPDQLLEMVQKQESNASKGKLKIFFGMCAGVGKTYAMLEEAQRKQKEGVQVIIGIINTHRRKETENLLEGLPIIPEKKVPYRGAVFDEFDIDAVLTLKPNLVLVDELAHTNVPGSRHRKRWQDVEELLDAGIDVYTTLNVQHIESRKPLVESIADVIIRETVPDSILERANSVEFIDIPPEELLDRLREGKVYTGELSKIAVDHFFKEDNLTALREIALRLTAEKVEHDLHGLLALGGRGWKTREKLMVAINADPLSEELIRASRKRAFEMDAPWICIYIDTGKVLTDPEKERLKRYLNLARELGAEVVTIHDLDVAKALSGAAKQKDVTQIIIGRPSKSKSYFQFIKKNLLETLQEENQNIDIILLRQNKLKSLYDRIFPQLPKKEKFWSYFPGYLIAFMTIALITIFGKLLEPYVGNKLTGFLFLSGILFLSYFTGIGEILFAAFLSSLSWALVFNESLTNPEDVALILAYFFVSSVIGIYTMQLRRQEIYLRKREESLNRMIDIEREMGTSSDFQDLKKRIIPKLMAAFPGEFDILATNEEGQLIMDSKLPILQNQNESAIAAWVAHNGKRAGWSTNTLSSAQGLYYPVKYHNRTVGVLAYQPNPNSFLNTEETSFFESIASRLGVFIERFSTSDLEKNLEFTNQIEKLHQAILRSVSRSFYGPLEKIFDSLYAIKDVRDEKGIEKLFEQTANSTNDLKLIIDNIVTISELESGRVPFEMGNYNFNELISTCKIELFSIMENHELNIETPPHPPLLPFDFRLMKICIKNLLMNALEQSPPNAPIMITLVVQDKTYSISISDSGPGIPQDLVPMIFQKFYQVPNTQSQGVGIGLAIVKSVIDLHEGNILISPVKPHGTKFTIILPL